MSQNAEMRSVSSRPTKKDSQGKRVTTLDRIQAMERQRLERRKEMDERKNEKKREEEKNQAEGVVGDVDFVRMIADWRAANRSAKKHLAFDCEAGGRANGLCICVRKRPIGKREVEKNDHDAVSCVNPAIVVHDCKHRVDGITKYLNNNTFVFDHAFAEDAGNDVVYDSVGAPLVEFVVSKRGRATVFAYGQTGSGKTYTMTSFQQRAARDLFTLLDDDDDDDDHEEVQVVVSFFEIYGGRCQDLLRDRARLQVREDGKGDVNVVGLAEEVVSDAAELLAAIDRGNRLRTTQRTEANDASSRSHAVCQIAIRKTRGPTQGAAQRRGSAPPGMVDLGKLSLVDLAGSERGADTRSHSRQLRTESAEINKSLLALKECIRGLATNDAHVPFRASKLTMVLRDSFVRSHCRVAMIATVSPSVSATDHTINTLRYADRVKEKPTAAALGCNKREELPAVENTTPEVPPRGGSFDQPRPQRRKERCAPPPPEKKEDSEPQKQRIRRGSQRLRSSNSLNEVVEKPKRRASDSDTKGPREAKEEDDALVRLHKTIQADAESADNDNVMELHRTVDSLFEEEEALLNAHMNLIQENAELLTEQGRMLSNVQSTDYDIDSYVRRLNDILNHKSVLIAKLQGRLTRFTQKLADEEQQSKLVRRLPMF